MNVTKIIGILLIVGSLFMGYTGIQKVSNSSASVEILGAELDVSNNSGKEQGYIYLGLAVIMLGGGLYLLSKKS